VWECVRTRNMAQIKWKRLEYVTRIDGKYAEVVRLLEENPILKPKIWTEE